MRTTDGGRHWRTSLRTSYSFPEGFTPVTRDEAWLVVEDGAFGDVIGGEVPNDYAGRLFCTRRTAAPRGLGVASASRSPPRWPNRPTACSSPRVPPSGVPATTEPRGLASMGTATTPWPTSRLSVRSRAGRWDSGPTRSTGRLLMPPSGPCSAPRTEPAGRSRTSRRVRP